MDTEAVTRRCSLKKAEAEAEAQALKKETLTQLFCCKSCEISKSTFSYRTPPVAASGGYSKIRLKYASEES